MVGGVLVSALKDLPNALLYEIQDKLMETAGVCDSFFHTPNTGFNCIHVPLETIDLADGTDECLDRIAAYISRLPPIKIEVVCS